MARKVSIEQRDAMMTNSPLKFVTSFFRGILFILNMFGRVGPKRRTRVRTVRMVT